MHVFTENADMIHISNWIIKWITKNAGVSNSLFDILALRIDFLKDESVSDFVLAAITGVVKYNTRENYTLQWEGPSVIIACMFTIVI